MFYKLYHLTLTLMPYSSSFILNQKGKCALDLLSNWEFEQLNSDHLSPFTSCFLCKMCHKNQSPAQTTIEWSCQFEWWTERRACPCLIWGAEVGPWCVWGVCVCVCVCLCVFVCVCVCVCAQSCLTLCDLLECSLPGSSVHGILQARMLECVAISFSRRSSHPKDWTCISCVSCMDPLPVYHLGSPGPWICYKEEDFRLR